MTSQKKKVKPTQGWLPPNPKRITLSKPMLSVLSLSIIIGTILVITVLSGMMAPGSSTPTTPTTITPTIQTTTNATSASTTNTTTTTSDTNTTTTTEPVQHPRVIFEGDFSGEFIAVRDSASYFHLRANYHVGPGLHIPAPPLLTLSSKFGNFSGKQMGSDFELSLLQPAYGLKFLGYWFSDYEGEDWWEGGNGRLYKLLSSNGTYELNDGIYTITAEAEIYECIIPGDLYELRWGPGEITFSLELNDEEVTE